MRSVIDRNINYRAMPFVKTPATVYLRSMHFGKFYANYTIKKKKTKMRKMHKKSLQECPIAGKHTDKGLFFHDSLSLALPCTRGQLSALIPKPQSLKLGDGTYGVCKNSLLPLLHFLGGTPGSTGSTMKPAFTPVTNSPSFEGRNGKLVRESGSQIKVSAALPPL